MQRVVDFLCLVQLRKRSFNKSCSWHQRLADAFDDFFHHPLSTHLSFTLPLPSRSAVVAQQTHPLGHRRILFPLELFVFVERRECVEEWREGEEVV